MSLEKHSASDVQRFLEFLAGSKSCEEAARRAGVPVSSLKSAVQRRTGGPASDFLSSSKNPRRAPRLATPAPEQDDKTIPVPPAAKVDPVAEHVERKGVSRLRKEHAQLLDRLHDTEARNAFWSELDKNHAPPSIVARETMSGKREATPIILASDWHIEESVDPVSCSGRNEYNLDIARARAKRFFQGVLWLIEHHRQSFTIRDAVLWIGGDIITGYIHEELIETNGLSPIEAVLMAQELLRDGIAFLLAHAKLERLLIPCSYGNHGRTTQKSRIKTGAKNSYEWGMYKQLEREFRDDPRVVFEITQSAHQYVQVYGFDLHFHHGDNVRYAGGVGGLSIPLNKRVPMWDKVHKSDYHHIGHYHQLLDLGHTLVNGSLIGYGDYAMSIGAGYEDPQQLLYLLDSKHGKCMVTPIWVQEDA